MGEEGWEGGVSDDVGGSDDMRSMQLWQQHV